MTSATYTTNPADEWLDLDDTIGQRSATFQFLLEDGVSGLNKGEIHPLQDSPATINHDAGRTIPRTMRLAFGVDDTALIDPLVDRILPYMLLTGYDPFPLGRFMVSDASELTSTGGNPSTMQLVDEMFIIDQEITAGFAPLLPESVMATILNLLALVDSEHPVISELEPSPFNTTGSWTIGTSRGQILEALATQGDYLRPWMDHFGVFRMRRTFDAAAAVAQFDYDTHHLVIRDTILTSTDLLTAPNRFVVTSNGGGNEIPITATADIPATAPHSIGRRGFVIAKSESFQIDSQEQAQAIANGLARTPVFEHTTLSTPPDPRHDGYDVVVWQGAQWLETGWSMELQEGGEMTHDLVRAYQ